MSLQEIINTSLRLFFRRIVSFIVPSVGAFLALALLDLLLTSIAGRFSGNSAGIFIGVRLVLLSLVGLAAAGLAVGSNGMTVSADLDGQGRVLARSVSGALSRCGTLFAGMLYYHLVVVGSALPGFGLFGASLWFSFHQQFLYSLGCILGGALLLYYPMKLFLQMILFGFVIAGEGASGWASLFRSRQIVKRRSASGGMGAGNTARVLILLHVSLVPTLVIFFSMFIPVAMLCLFRSPEEVMEELSGSRLTFLYAASQILNALLMGIIVPIFAVPLAVLYQDAVKREGAQTGPEGQSG